MRKKILFIGGHHNSALATVDWLLGRHQQGGELQLSFVWIGRKSVPGSNEDSPEYVEVTKRKIPFYHLSAGKLFRTTSIRYVHKFFYSLLLIPVGFVKALVVVLKTRPDLVVSFGGYLAVPVVVTAWVLRIPSVTHEQTIVVGLANKIISRFVKKVYVSWPLEYYDVPLAVKRKMVYTGLPLRKEILGILGHEEARSKLGEIFDNGFPTIYLTGGKTGALFLNKMMSESLNEVLRDVNLIWQCGHNSYGGIKKIVGNLPVELRRKVLLKRYIFEGEIGRVFKSSDAVITRGGAHTIYEIAVLEKPAIIIPIPWSSNDEQYKNAKILERLGLGKVINQELLTSNQFAKEVLCFVRDLQKYKIRSTMPVERQGQEKLGNEIIKTLTQREKNK